MRIVFWLKKVNPRTSKAGPGRGESLREEKLPGAQGGGLYSRSHCLVYEVNRRIFLECGSWSLPSLTRSSEAKGNQSGSGSWGTQLARCHLL